MQIWLLQTITLIDVIDIALLSYLVYLTLRIIHGTRALQSLAGLFFLLILYGVSSTIGLTGVYWLLDKFFVYLVLAIIILFQEDIRKGLARAGQFVPNLKFQQDVPTIESVVKTVFSLANRRIGALIILDRNGSHSLDETIQTGTPIDSIVSAELLTAIFLPTSPLHDGAVIIRNDRIVAAQCILPISSSTTISKVYGTRHRAGIGIVENTSTLALIVSEERGTVALAKNGMMQVVTNANELRQQLQNEMAMEED